MVQRYQSRSANENTDGLEQRPTVLFWRVIDRHTEADVLLLGSKDSRGDHHWCAYKQKAQVLHHRYTLRQHWSIQVCRCDKRWTDSLVRTTFKEDHGLKAAQFQHRLVSRGQPGRQNLYLLPPSFHLLVPVWRRMFLVKSHNTARRWFFHLQHQAITWAIQITKHGPTAPGKYGANQASGSAT